MTTYRLNLTSDEGDTTPGRILAALVTEDGATMAATLRAVADRLDPPVRTQNVIYRTRDDGGVWFAMNSARPVVEPMYAHDADCNTLHDGPDPCPAPVTVEVELSPGVADAVRKVSRDVLDRVRAMEPVRSTRIATITPDGCGPEHTFTGSCALTPPHRD